MIKTYFYETFLMLMPCFICIFLQFNNLFKYESRCPNPTFKFSKDSTFQTALGTEEFLIPKYRLDATTYAQFLTDTVYYWQVECPLYISPINRIKTTRIKGIIHGKYRTGISFDELGEEKAEAVEMESLGNGKLHVSKMPYTTLKQSADVCTDLASTVSCNEPFNDIVYVNLDSAANRYNRFYVAITARNGRYWIEMEQYKSQNNAETVWKFSGELTP